MDSEYNPPISLTHNQTENPFRRKHTNKDPNFFDKTKFLMFKSLITTKNIICFLLNATSN